MKESHIEFHERNKGPRGFDFRKIRVEHMLTDKENRPKTTVWYRRSARGEKSNDQAYLVESCFETNEYEIDMLASDCAEDYYRNHDDGSWRRSATYYEITIEIFEDEACEKSLGKFLATPIVTVGFVARKV